MAMLKQLTVNVPLVKALEKMPKYDKFMKDLVMEKRIVSYKSVDILHHYDAILTRSMVQKKVDLAAFMIPYTIRSLDFAKALCDLRARINPMPLFVYMILGLGGPTPTNMQLVMVDRSVKRPVGILYDVIVKVASFIFPTYFVILDYEVDFKVPIILGRPFLIIGSKLINLRDDNILFKLNDEVVRFNVCHSMKQHKEMSVFSIVDFYYEDEREVPIEEKIVVETLAVVLINLDSECIKE
ncbi:uncharacterized protein LOC124898533 [Capsicum annuum]|uniref:uncharacterized protein LOC124898533 n=1 Tax=Capsicum annuum TaxID=4072 RepID=UPI001FB14965|nr:uncharacterized protein LOC124898533 [Capsicum annuum]